ncbi:MAG: D-alanyl-D-alanine carboxypeptidase family protein [Pyrinomonadaceae bacterium]
MLTRKKIYVGLILLFAVVVLVSIALQISYRRGTTPPLITKTATNQAAPPEETPDKPIAVLSNFGAAAARNAQLMYEIGWAFGGKGQRGWYLYVPLIKREIGTDREPPDEAFAVALASWQVAEKIKPDGILDEDTWARMIAVWQSRRLKDHTPAAPGQLIVSPVADFWDSSRPEELRKVELQTYAAYKRMMQAAVSDATLNLAAARDESGNATGLASSEKFLKIVSAYRSREYQDRLRRASPNAGRAGLAVNSPHFTGHALDMYVGGDPVSTEDGNRAVQVQTPVYLWLVKNADKYGFRPYFYEPWHWEYVGEPEPAPTTTATP